MVHDHTKRRRTRARAMLWAAAGMTKVGNGGLDLSSSNSYTGFTTTTGGSMVIRGAANGVSNFGAIPASPGNDVFVDGTGWIFLAAGNNAINFGQKVFHLNSTG